MIEDIYTIQQIDDEDVVVYKNADVKNELLKKRFEVKLKRAGIPKEFWDISFEDYVGCESIDEKKAIQKYAESCLVEELSNTNLFLTGENNTQKSILSCNVGKEFLRQGLDVKFIFGSELIDLLLKNQGFSFIEEVDYELSQLKYKDLIIIDDFGKGTYWKNSTNLVIDAYDKFLRKEIASGTRFIITSNLSFDQIKKQFGDSLYYLLYRNFIDFQLNDSVLNIKRKSFEEIKNYLFSEERK